MVFSMKILKNNLLLVFIFILVTAGAISMFISDTPEPDMVPLPINKASEQWVPPSLYTDRELMGPARQQLIYGMKLVANTSYYLGPKGIVANISNGMNCQNCHLNAGKLAWGNNYGAVAATYPKFRARSGRLESIEKRVNDCFERSLNGQALDSSSKEMQAIVAYIKWLGKDVPKGKPPAGAGIHELPYLDRAANAENGLIVYLGKCQSCHGTQGEGQMAENGTHYLYPPLWGTNSYNSGAGLYRLSRLAGYVKDNMPFNQATHDKPMLSNAEAWDVAAFINSQPRPSIDISKDWPNIGKKPIDHPFGPYEDGFSEKQHKLGPFKPIADYYARQNSAKQ